MNACLISCFLWHPSYFHLDVAIYVLVLFQTFRSEFLLRLPRALSADVFLGIGSDADNASVSDDTDADADRAAATSNEAAQREREANEVDALRAAAVLVEVRSRSLRFEMNQSTILPSIQHLNKFYRFTLLCNSTHSLLHSLSIAISI